MFSVELETSLAITRALDLATSSFTFKVAPSADFLLNWRTMKDFVSCTQNLMRLYMRNKLQELFIDNSGQKGILTYKHA